MNPKVAEAEAQDLADRLRRWRSPALADYLAFVRNHMAPNDYTVNRMGLALGFCAESGEYGDLVKKEFLHGRANSLGHQEDKKKELGDAIWYWFACCEAEGFDPGEVLALNIEKLLARAKNAEYAAANPNVPTQVPHG